jgi:hypothetical protein
MDTVCEAGGRHDQISYLKNCFPRVRTQFLLIIIKKVRRCLDSVEKSPSF